jgi:hypothetical protein
VWSGDEPVLQVPEPLCRCKVVDEKTPARSFSYLSGNRANSGFFIAGNFRFVLAVLLGGLRQAVSIPGAMQRRDSVHLSSCSVMTQCRLYDTDWDGGWRALTDWISLGVLASAVPRDGVDDAVEAAGKAAKRSGGKLPPHVMVYSRWRWRCTARMTMRRSSPGGAGGPPPAMFGVGGLITSP